MPDEQTPKELHFPVLRRPRPAPGYGPPEGSRDPWYKNSRRDPPRLNDWLKPPRERRNVSAVQVSPSGECHHVQPPDYVARQILNNF